MLGAVRHQAITWASVDFWSSVGSSDIHLRTVQTIPQQSITKISLCKISFKSQRGKESINNFVLQGWGEFYLGTRLAQNDKHEYTKTIVLEYYLSTDFSVLVLVCSVLAQGLLSGELKSRLSL